MSKIVFFGIPAHGHTNPTLSVVRELISRGHQVWYYSYHALRDKIEETGAVFVSCDSYDMEQKLSPEDGARIGRDTAFSTQILVDTTLALDDKVCTEMAQLEPDCIVADSMALWGKAVALKLGIAFVSSTTTFAFNRHSAQVMKQSVGELFKLLLSVPKLKKQVKRLQDKGYPVRSFLDIVSSNEDTHTVVYTSPRFQPCSDTFSDKFAFVGPSVRPAQGRVEKTGEKLVYISMGTVNNDRKGLYRNCIDAFANTDRQVILSVGSLVSVDELGPLPENISAHSHVDQIAVLEQADVFLSHCGMNSVSESLWFGVPLVMLPQTAEQAGVANRVEQLGAGLRLTGTNAGTIRDAVERVLTDPAYGKKAGEISADFRACPGAKGAADKILQVCKRI